jgi:hypothetical protein
LGKIPIRFHFAVATMIAITRSVGTVIIGAIWLLRPDLGTVVYWTWLRNAAIGLVCLCPRARHYTVAHPFAPIVVILVEFTGWIIGVYTRRAIYPSNGDYCALLLIAWSIYIEMLAFLEIVYLRVVTVSAIAYGGPTINRETRRSVQAPQYAPN